MSALKCLRLKIKNGKYLKMHMYRNITWTSQIISRKSSISIGKGLNMHSNTTIVAVKGGKIEIGNNVSFNRNSICAAHEYIKIGDNTAIGPNVCIYDHDHKFDENGKKPGFRTSQVIIEENVWIGAGSIILRGTHIGKNTVIGAGCVVKGMINENSLVTQGRELKISKLEKKC